MEVGSKIEMISFNGLTEAPSDCVPDENFWKLISEKGTVVQDSSESDLYASFSKDKRVCVVFDSDLNSFGLVNHNGVPNSLWILVSDLKVVER